MKLTDRIFSVFDISWTMIDFSCTTTIAVPNRVLRHIQGE